MLGVIAGDANRVLTGRDAQFRHLLVEVERGIAGDDDMDGVGRFRARFNAAEYGDEIFGAQFNIELLYRYASCLQPRFLVSRGRLPKVSVLRHDDHIVNAQRDKPIGDHRTHHRPGGRDAEDIIYPVIDARRAALVFNDAIGSDIVVPGTRPDCRDVVFLQDAHRRQRHRAMEASDRAVNAFIKYKTFRYRLSALGDAFGIPGDDLQPIIDAVDVDAAFGVDVLGCLLHRPVYDDSGHHRSGRG